MQKRIKIYFHKHFFSQQELPLEKHSFWKKNTNEMFWPVKIFAKAVFELCFLVGKAVLSLSFKLYNEAMREFFATRHSLALRARKTISSEFKVNNASLFLGVFLLSGAFYGLSILASGLELKGQVLGLFTKGQGNLIVAKTSLEKQDFSSAEHELALALHNFSSAQEQLKNTNQRLKVLSLILPQAQSAKNIIEASKTLTESGTAFVSFYERIKQIKLTAEGISTQKNRELLREISEIIQLANTNLKQANSLLLEVDEDHLPESKKLEFIDIRNQVGEISSASKVFSELFKLFSQSLLNSKNILIVMQNNNELRATGGFMGSFAAIKQDAGKMSGLKIGSIYDLDGQIKEKILPPLPIISVNDRWYLRDSNWFADFPQSVKKITQFYEKSGGETPDMVVAINPEIIVDMLKLTGPVEMPVYNTTLNHENFVERVQLLSTLSNENPENQPKQILADLMPVLMQRIGSLNFSSLGEFLNLVNENLREKNILIYSRDSDVQQQLSSLNWSGEILETDRDYVSVVSSNLGATKTDLFVDQSMMLESSINSEGKVVNRLTLNFTNRLPKLDYSFNMRFIRIFVPKGSTLVSNTGFDFKNLETLSHDGLKKDPDVKEWEENAVREVLTGTLIGEEAGKTYFGNWLTLEGGESKQVVLTYELPFKLGETDRYSLLVQKQPGATEFDFEYNLTWQNNKVLWTSFVPEYEHPNKIFLKETLKKDSFWGMVMGKQ